MDINKKLPVWAMIALDLLLVAAIILPFAYVHHVRDMWGLSDEEKAQTDYTADPREIVAPTGENVFLTTETDHETGETTPGAEITPVTLKGDAEVRAYMREKGVPFLAGTKDASCDRLYRSQDVCAVQYSATEDLDGYRAKYLIIDIYVKNVRSFYTVNSRQKGMRELIAEGEAEFGGKVIAAVNGDYSSNKNHCRVVVRNGKLYRSPEVIDSDVCVMYYDGTVETYTPEEFDFEAVEKRAPYQIWDFGPELLDGEGRAKSTFDDRAYDRHILKNTHPRTALGYFAPGHYCFVVVDGRQNDETGAYLYGCSVSSLAKLMQRIGCARAYNMDGGDSSQAYMNGEDIRVDKTREVQRVLSDIICVGEVPGSDEETPGDGEQGGGAK